MRLSLKKRKKSKKDCLLALDIGTEFVKALVFKIQSGMSDGGEIKEQGIVMGFGFERQMPGHMLAGAVADIDGVALTCQKAINKAVKQARLKPKKAIIGIAGEYIKGLTTSFVYKRENPKEEIDSAELQNIIQRIQWRAFDRMRSQLAHETGRSEVEIKPINALLNEVRIDGYQVTNPLGFPGKEVFINIFNVYAPLVHLRAIESIAEKLKINLFSIAAEPYALTRVSGFNPTAGGIFIDIGGGTTDIALVRQNKVEGIKSFALAGRTFTKRLSQILNLDLPEAERIKMRHSEKRLSKSVQWKIRDILKNDLRIWFGGLDLALEEFNQAEYFPPTIFLCGGGSLLPGIRSILKQEKAQKYMTDKFPFSQPPKVLLLQPKDINDIIDKDNNLDGPECVASIALASLMLEMLAEEEKMLPPVLRQVLKLMK